MRWVERSILQLLEEHGSLGYQQIAALFQTCSGEVRQALERLTSRGLQDSRDGARGSSRYDVHPPDPSSLLIEVPSAPNRSSSDRSGSRARKDGNSTSGYPKRRPGRPPRIRDCSSSGSSLGMRIFTFRNDLGSRPLIRDSSPRPGSGDRDGKACCLALGAFLRSPRRREAG